MSRIFANNAPAYWGRGLSVIPITPGQKKPPINGWQGHCNGAPGAKLREEWMSRYADFGLGLLMGTEFEGAHLGAVDVDDDALVAVTRVILGDCPVGKRGAKGATLFVTIAPDLVKSTKIGKIDILARGKQTVLPPTIHPDTGKPYFWLGTPLLECDLKKLPELSPRKLELLRMVVTSDQAPALASGEGTHDAGVCLTARLVAFGCQEDEVTAIIRALLPPDYAGDSVEELPGWIRSAQEKGFAARSRLPLDEEVAHLVAENFKPLVYLPGEGFRQYRDGVWQLRSDRDIDRAAKSLLVPRLKATQQVRPYLSGVRQCLELNVERADFGKRSTLIGLRNGAYDVVAGRLLDHAPEHELRFQLDFDYDENAECPTYEEQVRSTLAGDETAIRLYDEFAALTLVPEMKYQKALYLIGEAGSGKSTLLHVLESMHDPAAVSVTPLAQLDSERYLTEVATKLVCISYDVQTHQKVFGEAFVRITGGDPIAIRRLYQEVEGRVAPTVRFVGSMNFDIPQAIASGDALRRRLIFLPCPNRATTPDTQRLVRLLTERPGIFRRWMIALRRLESRSVFELPPSSEIEVEDYTTAHDPIAIFAKERLIADANAATLISDLTREYNDWANDHGERQTSANVLGRKLRAQGFKSCWSRPETGARAQRGVRARVAGTRPAY